MKKLSWRFNPPSFRRKKRRQRRKVNTVSSPKPAWDSTVTKEQCFDDSLRKKEIFLPGGRERKRQVVQKKKVAKKKKKKNLTRNFRHRMRHMRRHEEENESPEEVEEKEEEEEIRSVSPEEAERLRERRRMELQLARKIQRRLRTDEMKVERMPLIRMLIRVARGVFPERRLISIDKFQRILGKKVYGGLSKPMSRWLALFLGSDGLDVCLEHLIDFLKSSSSAASSFPSDTPLKMKRFASSFLIEEEEEKSPQPHRVPSHLTTWQITVLMAIRDAIRSNRSVFSNSLRSETSSVRDMFRHAFQAFDLDGDGRIDFNEFRMVLERLDIRLSPKQIRSFLKTLDRNGDGKIDCEEFLNTLEMQLDRLPPTKTRLSPERRGTFWGTYKSSPDQKTYDDDDDHSKENMSVTASERSSVSSKAVESSALVKVQETYDNVLESLGQRLKDMVIEEENLKRELMSPVSSPKKVRRRRRKRNYPKESKRATTIDRARLLRLADINNRRFRYMFSTALDNSQEVTTSNVSRIVEKIEEHITDTIIQDVSKEFLEIVDGVVHGITNSM